MDFINHFTNNGKDRCTFLCPTKKIVDWFYTTGRGAKIHSISRKSSRPTPILYPVGQATETHPASWLKRPTSFSCNRLLSVHIRVGNSDQHEIFVSCQTAQKCWPDMKFCFSDSSDHMQII